MIISHKHRFIFIKTRKTAGTSIEMALSQFCGDDDVLTPFDDGDEAVRRELGYRGAQNYEISAGEKSKVDWNGFAFRPHHFNHESAFILCQRIDPEIWQNYYKFSVERNPWDRAISLYYFRLAKQKGKLTLGEFIRTAKAKLLSNFRLYAIDGSLAVEHVMLYENLATEVAQMGERLRLPHKLELPAQRTKSQFRADKRHYRELLDTEEREIIGKICEKEIDLFGYTF